MSTPYISLDIETTGLPHEDPQVLQLASIVEDWKLPIDELDSFNVIIDNGDQLRGNPYALNLNNWIIKKILKERKHKREYFKDNGSEWIPSLRVMRECIKRDDIMVVTLEEAVLLHSLWLEDMKDKHPRLTEKGRIYLGGKNVGSFDIPILEKEGFENCYTHRCVDPAMLYFKDFGFVPSLDDISELLDLPKVSHDALDDAKRVIQVVRLSLESN